MKNRHKIAIQSPKIVRFDKIDIPNRQDFAIFELGYILMAEGRDGAFFADQDSQLRVMKHGL